MKKRLIVQSVILLAVVVSMLTVATFAWFVVSDRVSTEMEISVVGYKSVQVEYFRNYGDSNGYVAAEPNKALIDDELFYPGYSAYCRLDFINQSSGVVTVTVTFEEVGISFDSLTSRETTLEQAQAEVDALNSVFYIQHLTLDYQNDAYEPDYDNSEKVEFLSGLKDTLTGAATGTIAVASGINVPAGGRVSLYYRFHLAEELTELSDVFRLSAQTIRVHAD